MFTAGTLGSFVLGFLGNLLQGVILGWIRDAQARSDQVSIGEARQSAAQAAAGAKVDSAVQAVADKPPAVTDLLKSLEEGAA